jgi:hypothetical protein
MWIHPSVAQAQDHLSYRKAVWGPHLTPQHQSKQIPKRHEKKPTAKKLLKRQGAGRERALGKGIDTVRKTDIETAESVGKELTPCPL